MKNLRTGLLASLLGLILAAPATVFADDAAEETPTLCEDGTECPAEELPSDEELEESCD